MTYVMNSSVTCHGVGYMHYWLSCKQKNWNYLIQAWKEDKIAEHFCDPTPQFCIIGVDSGVNFTNDDDSLCSWQSKSSTPLFLDMQVSTWKLLMKLAAFTIIKSQPQHRNTQYIAIRYAFRNIISLWNYLSGEIEEKFKMHMNCQQP